MSHSSGVGRIGGIGGRALSLAASSCPTAPRPVFPRRASLRPCLAAIAMAVLALAPVGAVPAAAQDPVAGDTVRQDTMRQDTLAADTVLTPAQLVLLRLRAMPASPIQGDSVPPDTTAADTLAADTTADPLDPLDPGSDPADPRRRGAGADPTAEMPADSVVAMLRRLAGYDLTEYTAEGVQFQADSERLRLTGESRVAREGSALATDSLIVYDGRSRIACGYGAPVLTGQGGDPLESDSVCYSPDRSIGVAVGARTRFQQGATWFVRGADNRVYLNTASENSELYGRKMEFTSCDLPEPHYVFEAGSMKMVQNEMLVARDVSLRFEDVPVFWLPWMFQSMKRGRRSGLLMPQFGANDIVRNSTGYNRHISNLGFYWAINDYLGAQGTFEWFSNNWTAAQGMFSYRWLRQFLVGNATVKQYWRESGRRELTINTSNSWQPDERTRVNLSGNYASSSDFVKQNSFDPRELNRQIVSNASVNRTFDWGSANFGAQRRQHLSDDKVEMTLPSLGVSLSSITLYSSDDSPFSVSWGGSGNVQRRTIDVDELLPSVRDQEALTASASHGFNIGRFNVGQGFSYSENVQFAKPVVEPVDSALPERTEEALSWSTSVGYLQNLWTGTTLTPRLSINGRQIRDPRTAGAFVAEPNRISAGASVNTAVYGFWRGVGPFDRIRHKIAPSIQWSYSPAPETTPLQDSLFSIRNLREQNRITLRFNQTFEGKYESADTSAAADPAGAGGAGAGEIERGGTAGAAGEPRRLPQARKITFLSINTGTPFVYDFVAADEDGRGFLTDELSNSLRSDLLRGFALSMSHDIFDEGPQPDDGSVAARSFDPHLTKLNASFSIDDDFWLFRFLGLTGGAGADTTGDAASQREDEAARGAGEELDPEMGAESDPNMMPGGPGSIVGGRGAGGRGVRRGIGGWEASLNYSLVRPREVAVGQANQMLRGNFSFRPTEHWSVRWSTGFSFTENEFSDHVLTLTRDLHRWQANFDFIKAQNGNFALQFRVQLIDNRDLKLDYDQRSDPNARFRERPGVQ